MWTKIESKWQVVDSQPIDGFRPVVKTRNMGNYPAILGRIPLFLPMNQRRRIEQPLVSAWGVVAYKNLCLNSSDEAVFIAVLNKGGIFEGSIGDMCRKTGSTSRSGIVDSLKSLCTNPVDIAVEYIDFKFKGTIASDFDGDENNFSIKLDDEFICKKAKEEREQHYRHIDMDIREGLSLTGKALHRFLTCHTPEAAYSFPVLQKAVAPLQRVDNFKREISEQAQALKELGFLKSYLVDKKMLRYERLLSA